VKKANKMSVKRAVRNSVTETAVTHCTGTTKKVSRQSKNTLY